jgi:SecD/SecF fusion protein
MEEVERLLATDEVIASLPRDIKLLWGAQPENRNDEGKDIYALYMIQDKDGGKPPLDGSCIVDARSDFDMGDPIVSMTMDATTGTPIWADLTTKASADNNRPIAIVMDNLVYSAPHVNDPITNGRSQITMGGNLNVNDKLKESQSLSGLLKAGSLPAPAKIVDEYTVGPSLGQENINSGLISFVIALLVILVYMIFYYKGAGVVSNIALIANLFFLIGALASLGAALTLPGIAGIVLTIGMAVDANVLIYERIREEMRHGKGVGAAIKDGYKKAYSAIIDANITTLLTAVILYTFGSGPIQGFATTLIIGIFTSLFSAIVITRLIFFNRLEKKKNITFSTNLTKDWFTKLDFQFVKKRKLFYVISSLIVVGGIISLSFRGLDYGVDFEGGSSFTVVFEEEVNDQDLRNSLSEAFTDDGVAGNPTVQSVGSSGAKYKIVTDYMINSEDLDRDEKVRSALTLALSDFGEYITEAEIKVDPSISDDFRRGARNATVFSLVVIFLYIFFRFRKWQYGLGALLAMIHDVLIVLSLFSIFYGILPFSLEVNQAFIAAILTVIGYSINDTVVVFDRIREYLKEHIKDDDKTVINRALNSTLSRTINTSLSTFVVLLTIFIFGGNDIKGFAFALMVGVVVGTYSSLFIATPTVIDFSKSVRTSD